MAIVYSNQVAGTRYEVRTAGNTVRLYSNGVLHSQYNPGRPISGAIWDLLLLPAFMLKNPPSHVLLLGLGGGTLVHLIRLFFPNTHITCVELDREHIKLAKRFFKLPNKHVTVIHGDAYQVLRQSQDAYDWIIDDVYQHINGEPERNGIDHVAMSTYQENLTSEGVLSLNIIGRRMLEDIHPLLNEFNLAVQFSHPLYDNRIVAMKGQGDEDDNLKRITKKSFNARLTAFKALDNSRKTCRLNFKMRFLK